MATINGSLGLPEDILDLLLEEMAGDIPAPRSRFVNSMLTILSTSEWHQVLSTRRSILTVCRLWNVIGRRHCWGSVFLSYTRSVKSFTGALIEYPHNATLVRHITILFSPDMIPDLITLLRIFVDHNDKADAQAPVNLEMNRGGMLVPTENNPVPHLQQLHIIDTNSWGQSNGEIWSEFIHIISRLKTLEVLAFHGIHLVPVPHQPTTPSPEASQIMKTLPHLTTLETSLSVKGHVRDYEAIESPIPIVAFSHAFQRCMVLPSLSKLTIRDLEYSKFGEDLFEFLAGFRTTLLYLRLEISEPPQRIGSPTRRLNPITMPNLRHLEISFPYQAPLLQVIHPENLQIITLNSVNRIFRSRRSREPRAQVAQLTQNDLLGDYTLSDLFSSIHDSLFAPGVDENGHENERITQTRRIPLKTIYLNSLRIHPLHSQEGLDYWNAFAETADKWSSVLEEKYGVMVLARSGAAMERDPIFRRVGPTISLFRPLAQLIKQLFEGWVEDIQRMYAYHQSISNSQQELEGNGDGQEVDD